MTVRGRETFVILQTFIVSRLCWRGASIFSEAGGGPAGMS